MIEMVAMIRKRYSEFLCLFLFCFVFVMSHHKIEVDHVSAPENAIVYTCQLTHLQTIPLTSVSGCIYSPYTPPHHDICIGYITRCRSLRDIHNRGPKARGCVCVETVTECCN